VIAFDVITAGLLFVLAMWVFILTFILGILVPFAVGLKVLFNRDLFKIMRDGFEDSLGR
jgi:hypothetical protein